MSVFFIERVCRLHTAFELHSARACSIVTIPKTINHGYEIPQ